MYIYIYIYICISAKAQVHVVDIILYKPYKVFNMKIDLQILVITFAYILEYNACGITKEQWSDDGSTCGRSDNTYTTQ